MARCSQFLSRVAPWTDPRIWVCTVLVVVQTTLDWVQRVSETSTLVFLEAENRIRGNNLRQSRHVVSNDELDDAKNLTSLSGLRDHGEYSNRRGGEYMLNKPAASKNFSSNFRFRKCSWSSVSVWKLSSWAAFLIKKVRKMPKVNRQLFEFLTATVLRSWWVIAYCRRWVIRAYVLAAPVRRRKALNSDWVYGNKYPDYFHRALTQLLWNLGRYA